MVLTYFFERKLQMNKKRLAWKQLGMVAVLVCSSGVWAAFTDGFEGGLGGWTTTGQVQTVEDEYARNLGLSDFWLPTEGRYFASLWSTDWIDSGATLSRSFEGIAGETLLFDYYFDFNDADLPDDPVPGLDWAKADLSGVSLFESYTLTNGWQTLTYVLPETKSYTLTFSISDWDGTFESVLGVDRVSVGQASVVPVPGAALLGMLGVMAAGWLKRRGSL